MNHLSAVRRNYDRLSRWYDSLSGTHEARVRTQALGRLALRPGERVLEIGTGTGQALPALQRAVGPGGQVIALDLSFGMLMQAQRRAAGQSALLQADAACLPLPNGCCSALLACFTLEIFSAKEIPAVLAEWRRVLEPGGRVGLAVMTFSARPNFIERLYAWSGRVFPQVVDCHPIDAAALLEQAGFRLGSVERQEIWGLPIQVILTLA
jgi:ubiquinone/menaquinone biosynthesis C-methylase UbiE